MKTTVERASRPRFSIWRLVLILALVLSWACLCLRNSVPAHSGPVPDHSSWMQDRLPVLGGRKLSELILPASHDAGMYRSNPMGWGQTQCLSIYGQLAYGVRWFDLRPRWTGKKFVIHHGAATGPDFSEVLADVKRFAQENHHELIILKLSHFEGITPEIYPKLAAQAAAALGPWLFKGSLGTRRLAELTLSEYVTAGPRILIFVDENYAIDHPIEGLWSYADATSDRASRADLRAYDVYSNTTDFSLMAADQFRKFAAYDGTCAGSPVKCDLFLLSWTLTPRLRIWKASQPALNRLRTTFDTTDRIRNSHGRVINLIYVDFVEYAHVTEVALSANDGFSIVTHP
jgi:hypothetical protein